MIGTYSTRPDILQPGMLRADAGIVEAGRDRMAFHDLAVAVLQQIGAVAVQHAGRAGGQRGAMLLALEPLAAGFDADDLDRACRRGRGGTGRWRWSRRRRRRPACRAGGLRRPASAPWPRGRSPTGSRAPSPDRDAGRRPCRSCNRCRRHWSPSRAAPRSWRPSACRGRRSPARTSAPSSFMRKTFGAWRSTSVAPM